MSEIRFDVTNPVVSGGTYSEQGGDESSCYSEDTDYCSTPLYGTCNNLYCHSNAAPLSGSNIYSQPTWSGAQLDCQSCHDPEGGTQPMSEQHGRHADA
ncbi:MAG: CxxxxCH/CxxCH domain-containing protein, partial [Deltaproteobacteria bacterium]|nr:CxxxxCH/CxxCH domain-containing protein [Deltaproteobacteria bacterium]